VKNRSKNRIKNAFSKASYKYHRNADLQKQTAERLARSIEPWKYTIPPGKVLEVGAGSGFLSNYLIKIFRDREIIVSDLSSEMLSICKKTTESSEKTIFKVIDAEKIQPDNELFSFIAGNFVAQWFRDPAYTLGRLCETLVPGGLMLMAFPGSQSFPEWRKKCKELGLPFTANPLPVIEEIVIKLSTGPYQVDFYEDNHIEEFESSLRFFQHLKQIGVSTSMNKKTLHPRDFRKLIRFWDQNREDKIKITYHIVFVAIKKK